MSMIVAVMVFTGFSVMAPVAQAEEETSASASASASVSAMSLYMWRGVRLSESMVLQPSVDFVRGSFGANIWTNIDMDPDTAVWPDDNAVLTETDITLSYSLPIEAVSVDVGYIYYSILGSDTQEVYISVGSDIGPIAPYVTVYYDYDLGTGSYIQLGADYAFDISDTALFSAGGYVSYLSDNGAVGVDADGEEYSAMHNAEVYASVSYAIGDISIDPIIAYSMPLSDDAEAAMTDADGDDAHFYGGITASLSF